MSLKNHITNSCIPLEIFRGSIRIAWLLGAPMATRSWAGSCHACLRAAKNPQTFGLQLFRLEHSRGACRETLKICSSSLIPAACITCPSSKKRGEDEAAPIELHLLNPAPGCEWPTGARAVGAWPASAATRLVLYELSCSWSTGKSLKVEDC